MKRTMMKTLRPSGLPAHRGGPTLPLTIPLLASLLLMAFALASCGGGGCPNYKSGVQLWANGPAYKGAVVRIQADESLTDDTRRIELMSIAGLRCTLDEDQKTSTVASPSIACRCAKPASADAAKADCDTWAKSL